MDMLKKAKKDGPSGNPVNAEYLKGKAKYADMDFRNQSQDEKSSYLLSVVIPVYNNGKYLKNICMRSLKRSSIFTKMEIIIVDDGSSDKETLRIIDILARENPNIRTYYYHNGGSGSASRPRNKGIELASSEYITFLDPDNEAVNDGYAMLLNELKKDRNLDLSIGDILKVSGRKEEHFQYYNFCTKRNNAQVTVHPRNWLINTDLKTHSIQALIIKKEVILRNNLRMIEGAGGQDSLFFLELLLHCNKLKVVDCIIHIYYAEIPGSITNTITKSFYNKWLLLEKHRLPFLRKHRLLDLYMNKRFNYYFKNWYLKKLGKVKETHIKESIDTIYRIYRLYSKYLNNKDHDLIVFETLYKQKSYKKIYNYFKKVL
ncbi:hypothetical protein BK139_01815 [Paenibacillus sp. FSL R5-0490]|uniref:glycosyltransferase family 2 protein n=1 Tax=Bacillales TaxID=1385 RepID=UPI00096CF475|nr:glycosyltransferase family 2 protein [Paenibacillus sp. FSL R5-0490]OMF63425.1 hypothetical protein BK139_01815 [Paenibacillus sp. FSL R5-0490]